MPLSHIEHVLTVAGSDSGGGAGIQADLKTFAAFGVYGASAITAITAQNTRGIEAVVELAPSIVAAQIDAVINDIGADSTKTGMLANAPIIQTVAASVRRHKLINLIVDPVMVAKSGDQLLHQPAIEALRFELLPLALVVTPNIPEAEAILGKPIRSINDMRQAAEAIAKFGPKNVVLKGGHLKDDATDVLWDGTEFHEFGAKKIITANTHGTGCTFASAIAALIAKGYSVAEAVAKAKDYVTQALKSSFAIGEGHSPVHHFYQLWNGQASK